MNALLVTADLMVVSRVEGAAGRNDFTLRTSSSVEHAVEQLANEAADLIFVDLATPSIDVGKLADHVRTTGERSRIVAFGPHVHEERLSAARKAGCDEVVSRGQFLMQLDSILARLRAI